MSFGRVTFQLRLNSQEEPQTYKGILIQTDGITCARYPGSKTTKSCKVKKTQSSLPGRSFRNLDNQIIALPTSQSSGKPVKTFNWFGWINAKVDRPSRGSSQERHLNWAVGSEFRQRQKWYVYLREGMDISAYEQRWWVLYLQTGEYSWRGEHILTIKHVLQRAGKPGAKPACWVYWPSFIDNGESQCRRA